MAEDSVETPRPLAEISHGPSAFETFLERNQKGMIALGVVLVAATATFIVMRGLKEESEHNAGAILVKSEGIPQLQALVKEKPDTAAAGSAQLVIAEKQWEAGDQDAAIETLKGFISSTPDHPGVISAKASLATRLQQQGKKDEAKQYFQELVNDPAARYVAPYALVSLGDMQKAGGKLDEAEQSYKKAVSDYGTNPLANLGTQRLNLLRFKDPVAVEAPPAPPAPEGGEVPAPGGILDGAAMPKELEGPLGSILSGGDATPPEEAPATPAEETVPPAEEEQPAPPSEQPAPPVEAPKE
ncbi:tetratricopeptide repeat protein [Luteolibacter flavescens]|uniref:Tetratricopeptide repeat protein n=1 Tax=Luteolibacter flavescens TaxID=1859460 RepID=A0ABT3FRE6_9BACT|nr:tetratricopeptide repeat protein [Luteolibacter flavescens]MCW1886130.1 tetratricopeptide repeat protein [Luteolibacter flavescens]